MAGLVAYFLSINPRLKSDPKSPGLLPQKVKSFITDQSLAWARQGGDLAISNGLESPRIAKRELQGRADTGAPSCIAQSGASVPVRPSVGSGGSGKTSSTQSANTSSTATSTSSETASVSTTTGMLDGAPWLDPTSFCDFGSATYPMISIPSTITDTAKLCAYTSLNPKSAITPKQTSAIPTNWPGYGGVPGCAAVVFGPAHMDCPYGTDGWCNCGGVIVPPLAPTKSGIINCDITVQPTSSSCPVNTAYSKSLSAASASSAAASSRYEATAKAHPNTVVSSFACPTDAVIGGPDGFGNGQSNQETIDDPKSRQQLLWANFNSWGCDMPTAADNDAIANTLCGNIPPNTVLSLGIGKQPFYYNSSSHDADDKNCQKQFYNIAFTVKDKCLVTLTKEYCMGMYNNIKNTCPTLNPKGGATWEGGIVTDNCGIAAFTSGYDITQGLPSDNNPFFDKTASYWWE